MLGATFTLQEYLLLHSVLMRISFLMEKFQTDFLLNMKQLTENQRVKQNEFCN